MRPSGLCLVNGAGKALTAAALTSLWSLAWSQDFPPRKPGLWEISVQSDKEPAVNTRQCIDEKTDAKLQQAGRGMVQANCAKDSTRREGSGWVSESVCKVGNSTVTSRSTISGDFNREIKFVVDAQFAPPFMGTAKSSTTVVQKWGGACPAGWRAGDMELPGMKQRMNINDLPAMGAAPKR